MKTYLLIVIIHNICAIKCASFTIAAALEGNQTQQIQDLEKEKIEIYSQINDAVKDTIKTLEKSNDSDARQGIAYMKELLALIDQFNGTELELDQAHPVCNSSKECASNQTTISKTNNSSNFFEDGRRRESFGNPGEPKGKYKNKGYDHIKHNIMAAGLKKQRHDDLQTFKDDKVSSLLALQAKLDGWLKLREAEKQKIKQYKLRQIAQRRDSMTEECPDFGETRKKSKGEYSRKPRKYPCCRKCCKKSYLGCL